MFPQGNVYRFLHKASTNAHRLTKGHKIILVNNSFLLGLTIFLQCYFPDEPEGEGICFHFWFYLPTNKFSNFTVVLFPFLSSPWESVYRFFIVFAHTLGFLLLDMDFSRGLGSSVVRVASHADVLRLVTRSSPRTSAQRTGHIRSLAVSQS